MPVIGSPATWAGRWAAKQAMLNVTGRYCQNVIHQQLQAALTLIFVHVETVAELHFSLGRDEAAGLLAMVEGYRIERPARFGNLHPHFQVTLAHDAGIADGEDPIEARLRKCLSPGPAAAQRVSGLERNLLHRKLPIRFNRIGPGTPCSPAPDLFIERP